MQCKKITENWCSYNLSWCHINKNWTEYFNIDNTCAITYCEFLWKLIICHSCWSLTFVSSEHFPSLPFLFASRNNLHKESPGCEYNQTVICNCNFFIGVENMNRLSILFNPLVENCHQPYGVLIIYSIIHHLYRNLNLIMTMTNNTIIMCSDHCTNL